ncbi:growth inhibitor [Leptolyngbya sp. PCC 7375]|nr:growth inhibitor [Leptolyngbya sp. PCC 7375]
MSRKLRKGDIVLVTLPEQYPSMHEQQGMRPALIVGIPPGETRFLLAIMAPMTTQIGDWTKINPKVYPVLPAGTGNLKKDSVVLLDQIRAVDMRRITKYLGSLTEAEYKTISVGLDEIF